MIEDWKVREKAYELWEKDGRPQCADEFYWRLAQDQLKVKQPEIDTAEPEPNEWESSSSQSPLAKKEAENKARSDDSEWPAKGEASRY
ncbi:Protein of unknown function [Pseudomonas arsenicoxydans]|uniref:DUF2934 domain-containing protein n=1 Tax=Pseudomonas arsenicoxydans TaxID=702115 RepID=A0A1H0NZQ0_9PSED|nr:DUF2934 domain-containing protein [Pseudomonas arsenicoxydans]SDO97988.1 Protein of unknown function [Pseudomonas arsenicoxydans]